MDLYEEYKNGKGKDIDILVGSNEDEVRYWIKTLNYYSDFISGEFAFKHGLPVLFENNINE